MLKTIKFMLLGIALIFIGIWSVYLHTFLGSKTLDYIYAILFIFFPIIGLGLCLYGFFRSTSAQEAKEILNREIEIEKNKNEIFHSFKNQKIRKLFGGNSFMELQYCTLEPETDSEESFSDDSVKHWEDNSLYIYIDDIEEFLSNYGNIFFNGNYNEGTLDISDINYYSPEKIANIISEIKKQKPLEYTVLLDWLSQVKDYKGIYILAC